MLYATTIGGSESVGVLRVVVEEAEVGSLMMKEESSALEDIGLEEGTEEGEREWLVCLSLPACLLWLR